MNRAFSWNPSERMNLHVMFTHPLLALNEYYVSSIKKRLLMRQK